MVRELEAVKKAVAEYTGREVLAVDVVADPVVREVYAIRARFSEDSPIEFTVSVPFGLANVATEDLCEVEFESWPPRQR